MEYDLDGMDVLFVAGFGPITQSTPASREFYVAALGLPLKPMPGNEEYLLTEHDAIGGVKHLWPDYLPVPQAWVEFEVRDINTATDALKARGYRLLVDNRIEPWGQTVTRLLSPEGLLTGITVTPWLREGKA